MYTLLSGVDTTLRDLPPLRRHVPLSASYRSVKALISELIFQTKVEEGKPEYPEKNLSEKGRERTTNSTHI